MAAPIGGDVTKVRLKDLKSFRYRINPEERQGAYGYYFFRPISLYVTYLALRLGFSANQVTVLQAVAGLAGAVCLAFPSPALSIAGIVLLQLGYLLDNVDGEVARFRQQVSLTGKYLDTLGHELVVPCMYFALGVSAYFRLGHFESVVFGFLAGLFSLRLDFAAMYQEAAQFVESKLDRSYDYYAFLKPGATPRLFRQKNEPSASRMLYALFAYPATMNIAALFIVADIWMSPITLFGYPVNLVYLFLMVYGTLLPLRRVYTIWKLAKGRETEKKYLMLINLLKDSGAATAGAESEEAPDTSAAPQKE